MTRSLVAILSALLVLAAAAPAAENGSESPWALPPTGACGQEGKLRGWPSGMEAPALPWQPGDVVKADGRAALEPFVPKEIWTYRDRFLHEEMELEIGPCFADYSPPQFYRDVTQEFAGKAQLLENGGLGGYVAGQPFPLDAIELADPDSGLKWAWNIEQRYQGAGFRGKFRLSDVVGRALRAEPFEGEIYQLRLMFRADLPSKYEARSAKDRFWVAGGTFFEPYAARNYTWRQFRHVDTLKDPGRTDDLHAYLPSWRRVRRMPSTNVEGLYMPSFAVGLSATESAPGSGPGGAGDGSAAGTAGQSSTTITTKRSGFEGLEIRPLLYDYRVLGVRDVLAPINARHAAYPEVKDRDFGPWGLSFASDRWELRRALVLEGKARGSSERRQAERVIVHADIQTGQPLYYVSYRYSVGRDLQEEVIDVGVFVGRWSEERDDYPKWPGKSKQAARVIDPVGAAFANIEEDGGWRRESWTVVSTPPEKRDERRMISVNELSKRR